MSWPWPPTSARPVTEWVELVARIVRSLLSAPPETAWQMEVVERALADALDAAGGDQPSAVLLDWADIRRLLGEHLAARRGRNDFFRGGMTITSLIPLRWVPFRVVCLLGMDQAALTGRNPAGDDLAQAPAVLGDRDPRSDLRQALLEAVLAAEDHLLAVPGRKQPADEQGSTTRRSLSPSSPSRCSTRSGLRDGTRSRIDSRSIILAIPSTSAVSPREALSRGCAGVSEAVISAAPEPATIAGW